MVVDCLRADEWFRTGAEVLDSLEAREREEERGEKPGRWGAEDGARWLGRRGAGEMPLCDGGGGEPEGVECDDRRSSHISPLPDTHGLLPQRVGWGGWSLVELAETRVARDCVDGGESMGGWRVRRRGIVRRNGQEELGEGRRYSIIHSVPPQVGRTVEERDLEIKMVM
jgi:hypothetical protein